MLGSGAVLAVFLLLWYFIGVVIPGLAGLVITFVAAVLASVFIFVMIPLLSIAQGSKAML